MSQRQETVPQRRRDLVVRQVSEESFVVKVPSRREYFSIGAAEHFLLERLDGESKFDALCEAFEQEFDDRLSDEDIDEFLDIVRSRGLLQDPRKDAGEGAGDFRVADSTESSAENALSRQRQSSDDDEDEKDEYSGSLLYFRVRLYDPDKKFNFLEPLLRWVWTPEFLLCSGLTMLFALSIIWSSRDQLMASFPNAMRWETVAIIGVTIFLATIVHEYAHGLTCKHFGGEVHDVGVLVMFFIPCLYCDVSDAWLIPGRLQRLLITAAGGYADLCVWALAVFVWRLTVPGCLVNYVAFVVLTVCGSRGFLNFNPLLRLDGYYLLSDGLGIANLRTRATDYFMGHVRWLLWGASRPEPQPKGKILLSYGLMKWFFAIGFLDVTLIQMTKFLGSQFGVVGIAFTTALLLYACKRVFKGFFKSEFRKMIKTRHTRTAIWAAGILAALILSFVVPVKNYVTGDFEVRPGEVFQLHSPVTGFVKHVYVEEGARVNKGDPIALLAAPEVESQLAAKEAELAEVEAVLTKLRLGPRPEQLQDQRSRVARLREWHELGLQERDQSRLALLREVEMLNHQVRQVEAELELSRRTLEQSEKLYRQGAVAGVQLRAEKTQLAVLEAKVSQARAAIEIAKARGTREADAELSRRERELAEAEAALTLLQAGSRPEEISAEVAHRERVLHQLEFLRHQQASLLVRSPVDGVVATPRMQEKAGLMLTPGLLLCTIEDASISHVELAISEDDARDISLGLPVNLKIRAIPFETFHATVERIATATTKTSPTAKNTVVVHCQIENPDSQLKSGMTGFGRIYRGWRTIGVVMLGKSLKYLRTEFWW